MASNTKYYDNLTVSSSPHLVTSLDTTRTMLYVVAALLPAAAMSVLYFGIPAVIMIAVCMICSAFFEWAYEKLLNKPNTVRDGSALVTGLILALNLPANLTHLDGIEYPIFMPILICIIGSFVAIVVVKQLFGGMGRNFANPAIVGRITLFLSFTSYMSTWPTTRFQKAALDAVTSATPLGYLADGDLTYCPSLKDMFLGNIGGAMGETCVIAILIGAIFLIAMKIISSVLYLFSLSCTTRSADLLRGCLLCTWPASMYVRAASCSVQSSAQRIMSPPRSCLWARSCSVSAADW